MTAQIPSSEVSPELLKELEEAERNHEEVLESLFKNPKLDDIGKYVAYLLQKDSTQQEQSLLFNALLSTVVDVLEEKGIIEKESFGARLEETVKTLNEELLNQYAEYQTKLDALEEQAPE